jgi:pyruvate/2-oxoglutarate dehydrogenase complex dihydrolipoamide acyltransferase (E2) component
VLGCRARAEGEEVSKTTGTEIKVPTIAGAAKLSIGRWFKRVGDPVSVGEPLVEIDTYNLTHEIRAPATGILAKIWVMDGGSVEPGTVVDPIDRV